MAPRATSLHALPAASAARQRSRKRAAPTHQKAVSLAVPTMPLPSSTSVCELRDGAMFLPIKFQCPLCLDVLRAPVSLPCCARHLCRECFERALELTSANCGFCRKRIVGLARKKQFAVDEPLWHEIRALCPFLADAAAVVDVEFIDENAPPKHVDAGGTSGSGSGSGSDAVRAPEIARPQQTPKKTRHTTMATAADASPDAPPARREPPRGPPPSKHTTMQRRLEAFFAGTLPSPDASARRPSSAGSVRSLRSTTSNSSGSGSVASHASGSTGPARGRRRAKVAVGKKSNVLESVRGKLRSASHSPTKQRPPPAVQRKLLQLTLHSPVGRTTRQSSSASSSSSSQTDAARVVTRPRRPWLCRHCTFENTCFDTRCSMCHQYPANAPLP